MINIVLGMQFSSEGLDNQGQVDVIYQDLSKAFDLVNHNSEKIVYFLSTSFTILTFSIAIVNPEE